MKGQFIAKLRSAKKTPKVTSVSEKIHILQGNGFVWKDLQNPDRSKLEELQKEHGLNALNVEDCLTKFELPKLDSYNDHVFFIYPCKRRSAFSPDTGSCAKDHSTSKSIISCSTAAIDFSSRAVPLGLRCSQSCTSFVRGSRSP